ncbi:hypothetical protein V6N11_025367, partial [Hibiscus sabdariffa]
RFVTFSQASSVLWVLTLMKLIPSKTLYTVSCEADYYDGKTVMATYLRCVGHLPESLMIEVETVENMVPLP